MKECIYKHVFPVSGCCWAYWESIRPDRKYWAHWPKCSEDNCPLKHPELLEGARLKRRK